MRSRAAAALVLALLAGACSGEQHRSSSAAGYRVYVSNEKSGDLTVLDGATGKILSRTPVGKRPRGLALSPDGKLLLVATTGSPVAPPGVDEKTLPPPDRAADGVVVIDRASGRVLRVAREIPDPEQLAAGKDGLIYAGSEIAGAVDAVDPQTGKAVAEIKVGDEPEGVAVSPDGRFLYVTLEDDNQVAVVDVALRRRIKLIAVGERPRSIAFSPDGSRAYVTNELGGGVSLLDAGTHSLIATTKIAGEVVRPMGVVVSKDGKKVYVTTGRGGELLELDAAGGAVTRRVKVGQRPWGVAISPDGRRLFTANGPSGDVSIVDAASMSVVAQVKTGDGPWGVATGP